MNNPELIDIHSHLDFSAFDEDREAVILRMLKRGVWSIIVGIDKKTSKEAVSLAEKYFHLFASVGLHPTDVDEDFDCEAFRTLAKNPRVVAIGECGLDYFRMKDDEPEKKKKQKEVFRKQIALSLELDKPLMIHCREAYDDVLDILKRYPNVRGNMHFFAGDWDQARKFLDLGFYLSFTGVITFARQYDEVIRKMPLERLMVETDAPFVAPESHRGKRCEPVYVEEVVKKIADLRGVPIKDIVEITISNARKFFGI